MKNCEVKYYDMNVDGYNSTLFVIIDLADDIIGSCMMFDDGLIQDFHVVEKFRGVGIGRGLLASIEKAANRKGIKTIHGLVQGKNKAIGFWRKHHFILTLKSDGIKIKKSIV